MDVLFMNSSVYEIPSSSRVGAIVYDGARDMRLWTGPGPDRELDRAWGGALQAALDVERSKLGLDALRLGTLARVHKGRLHCDFLAWVATRQEELGVERSAPPGEAPLGEAVMAALEFVAERTATRVAFPALGDGPGAVAAPDRLAIIVRASHAYAERCFAEGRAAVVEEVIVCEPSVHVLASAKRLVAGLVRTAEANASAKSVSKGRGGEKTPAKRRRATRTTKKEPPKPTLTADEIGTARATATAYDMSRTYAAGDCFIHPKFGVGRVFNVTQENAIEVVFEDRSIRKMVHARG